jgi:glycosyltransferase involved in cell wall biosynthesis
MKVLLVMSDFFEPQYHGLWEEAERQGVKFDVVLGRFPEAPNPTANFGDVTVLDPFSIRDRLTWRGLKGLGDVIADSGADLIHILQEPWAVVSTQVILKKDSRPIVTQGAENLWDQGAGLERQIRRRIVRHNLPRTSGFVSWNTAGVEWAQRSGLRASSPVLVQSSGLPQAGRFQPRDRLRSDGRERFSLGAGPVLGYVGRLIPEKGIDWLLRSWPGAAAMGATLVIAGDGPLREAVQSAASTDPSIRVLGSVASDQIPSLMAALDALVLPSLSTRDWEEQWGRVLVEAMAAGTPIIASRTGAIPEVVGRAGVMVTEGSTPELSEAIERVLSDQGSRELLSAVGIARAENEFDVQSGAERMRGLWTAVLKGER